MRNTDVSSSRWVIIGGGAFGREIADWIIHARKVSDSTISFVDDVWATGELIAGRWKVIGNLSDYRPVTSLSRHIVSVSNPDSRELVVGRMRNADLSFGSAMFGTVASSAKRLLGHNTAQGLVMFPGSVISSGAKVGAFCHINLNSTVGHDVVLGNYCTLACGVDLMGGVKVGRGVTFGSGSRVLPGLTIGDRAVIGAGAVVMRDVPAGAKMLGNPAREI
jgi:sugar O-acyltransferase (sialic acid O-acetyltransferase NeuD family)